MIKKSFSSNNMGFTLVELISVLVLVGLLSVVALPRFLNVFGDAHKAAVNQISAQFQKAIDAAHFHWLLNGRASNEINDMPGYGLDKNGNPQLDMNPFGYPIGVDKGNPMGFPYTIGQRDQGCVGIWEAIMETDLRATTSLSNYDGYDFVTRREMLTFTTKEGDTVTAEVVCYYTYTRRGYNTDPNKAEFVMRYNSLTGKVTLSTNNL